MEELPATKSQENTVFISYAREDFDAAKRLQKDLKDAVLNTWLDKEKIFLGLGYVQNEFKFALEVLKRYPSNMIFYLPVRLDDCEIPYKELISIPLTFGLFN